VLDFGPSTARERESTRESIGAAPEVETNDSMEAVAVDSASEQGCISSLSTGGEEAECAAEDEGRVPATGRRSPESPAYPTPKLHPDLVVLGS